MPSFVHLGIYNLAQLESLSDHDLETKIKLRPLQIRKLKLALARRLEQQERAVRRASMAVVSQGTGLMLNAARLRQAGVITASSSSSQQQDQETKFKVLVKAFSGATVEVEGVNLVMPVADLRIKVASLVGASTPDLVKLFYKVYAEMFVL